MREVGGLVPNPNMASANEKINDIMVALAVQINENNFENKRLTEQNVVLEARYNLLKKQFDNSYATEMYKKGKKTSKPTSLRGPKSQKSCKHCKR